MCLLNSKISGYRLITIFYIFDKEDKTFKILNNLVSVIPLAACITKVWTLLIPMQSPFPQKQKNYQKKVIIDFLLSSETPSNPQS